METVLLYNIAQTPLASGLKPILLKMKVRIRVISPEQYDQPLGVLAGLPGFQELDNVYEGDGFSEPMIVLCGFTDQRLDQFLRELRKKKLPPIPLKAILTPHNQNWDSITLYQELKSEHEAMHRQS